MKSLYTGISLQFAVWTRIHRELRARAATIFVGLLLATAGVPEITGATLRWTGGHASSANWSRGLNWDSGNPPVDGDTVLFPDTGARKVNTNDIAALNLTALRFSGAGGGYTLRGNGVTVTNSLTATNNAGINTVSLDRLTLGTDLPLTSAVAGTALFVTSEIRLNNHTLTLRAIAPMTLSGPIIGNGEVVKELEGNLTLTGGDPNTFSGDFHVNEGSLRLLKTGGALAIPHRLVIGDGLGGAQADQVLSLSDNQVNEVTVNQSGLWNLGTAEETVADLVLAGGGDVTTDASGLLRLGPGAEVTVTPGLSLVGSVSSISGKLELLAGAHVFSVGESATVGSDPTELIIDADISGLGGITKEGNGDMMLTGDNSFEALVNVNGGELRLGSPTALGNDLFGTRVNNDATLWLQGNLVISDETLEINSTGVTGGFNSRPALRASGPDNVWVGEILLSIDGRIGVMENGFLELAGPLRGPGSLVKEDVGTFRFSTSNLQNFSGNLLINGGVFELNHGFTPATIPANLGVIVVGDGIGGRHADVLRNLGSSQVGVNIPFVGWYSWPVVVNGSGFWDLNNHVDTTSLLTLHDGGDVGTGVNGIIAILIGLLADPGPAPDHDAATISGNVLPIASPLPVAVTEGDSSTGDRSDLIVAASVVGGNGWIKTGLGDLELSSSNAPLGAFTIASGELRVGHPHALGPNPDPVLVVSNATLWLQGGVQAGNRPLLLNSTGAPDGAQALPALKVTGDNRWGGDITLGQNTRIAVATNGQLTLAGAIAGSAALSKESPGTLVYTGPQANTYSGLTVVSEGRLALAKAAGVAPFGGSLIVGDGAGAPGSAVTEFGIADLKLPSAEILVNRSGLALVTAETTIGSIAGSGRLQVGAVFDVGRSDVSTTFSGPIAGSGVINKFGRGTLSLEGTNTLTGLAAFDGTLTLNGPQPNTAVIVFDPAILGGTGRTGPVLGWGGTVAPGSSPGILGTGDLTLKAELTCRFEFDGPTAGTGHDQLKVNGVVRLGGARLVLNRSSAFTPTAGQTFTIIENDGADPVDGTFAGLSEGATLPAGAVRLSISYRGGDGNDVTLAAVGPAPPCPDPVLSIQTLANSSVQLSWPSCPSNFYQVAWTTNFQQWQMLTPPLAAPETNDIMTWTTPMSLPHQFFQLILRPLTNSVVPTNAGIYPGRTLTHNGITRTYRLLIPERSTNGAPAPLMLALHGHNQTAQSFAGNIPALSTYANNGGVILVFPDGTADSRGTGWNILPPTPENPVDDVGFLLALIDELDGTLNIDRKRIYAGGFSNGGQMCHRLAAATSNVFAAFAAVGSAVAGEFGTGALVYQPPPSEPNSILIVNATNDCKRPFWGGINVDGALQPPARDSLIHWTNADFCTPSPVLRTNTFVTNHVNRVFADCGGPYPPFNAPKTNQVIREHYQLTCTPGAEVLFVTLTDGGHAWPEAVDNVGFDTSREVLEFFLRHCRCDLAESSAVDPLPVPIPTTPGQYELRLCDQGYSRLFRLQIPAGYNPAVPAPLAFVFHGGQQTVAAFSALHPGLFTKANTESMLLILPEALPHPATGQTLWGDRPFDTVVDDARFVTNLLERLDAALNVDRLRVYAAGFSSGGEFCNWLAGTTTGWLAAIAPVCAQTGWNEPDANGPVVAPPPPLEPIAVLMVRGSADPKRPFNGGANSDGVLCRSAADDVAYWTAGNTCAGAPVITTVGALTEWEYAACAGTTEVVLVRVTGLGHAWPDVAPYNANVQVIDFLLTHTR